MPEQWTTVHVDGQDMWAYVSLPQGPGPHPGVVVIQHGVSLDYWLQDICRRISSAGYAAIAPDLYHRVDPSDVSPDTWRDRYSSTYKPNARRVTATDENIIKDVNATIEHLRTHPAVRGDQIGITGFCMGGRVAYLMATSNPLLQAAALFYSADLKDSWGDGLSPFDRTPDVHCPVIGFYGEDDRHPPPEEIKSLDAELTRHDKVHEFHFYAGVGHGFQWDGTEKYHAGAARDSWEKMLTWFQKYLRN